MTLFLIIYFCWAEWQDERGSGEWRFNHSTHISIIPAYLDMSETGSIPCKCRIGSCLTFLKPDYKYATCPACREKDSLSKRRRRNENLKPANKSEAPAPHPAKSVATPSLRSPLSAHTFNVEHLSARPDDSNEEEKPSLKRQKVSPWWYPPPFLAE
jgi:hypothetical protein